MDSKSFFQEKANYIKQLRTIQQNGNLQFKAYIPRPFQHITPNGTKWIARPQSMLLLFQEIVLSISDARRRIKVLNNLLKLTNNDYPQNISQDHAREQVQHQIFESVTGQFYSIPLQRHLTTMQDIQRQDFFQLISMGIRAYIDSSEQEREQFNSAIISRFQKQQVIKPYRFQQEY